MKKKIILASGIFAFGIALLLIFKISHTYNRNKAIALQKQSLPAFEFYNQKLDKFKMSQLKKGVPVCIFYYNSDCDHCQYEVTEIRKNIKEFKNVQIVMISTNTPNETLQFINEYKLSDYSFIIWLYDKDYNFYKWFGKSVTPSVYIYNKQHRLIKEYKGEVKIKAVLDYLQND